RGHRRSALAGRRDWPSVTQPAGAAAQAENSADAPAFLTVKSATNSRGIMGSEILRALNEEMYVYLMMMMTKTVTLIIGLASIAGFAVYLIGVACLILSEARQSARRLMRLPPESPEPDEYDLLVTRDCLDDSLAGEAMRQ